MGEGGKGPSEGGGAWGSKNRGTREGIKFVFQEENPPPFLSTLSRVHLVLFFTSPISKERPLPPPPIRRVAEKNFGTSRTREGRGEVGKNIYL